MAELVGRFGPAPTRPHLCQVLLCHPQTSRGLLGSCTLESVEAVLALFKQHGFDYAAPIAKVTRVSALPRLRMI